MFAPILNNVAVIATFIAFALIVKGTPTDASVVMSSTQEWLLAAGTTGGVAAMALALAPALFRLPDARLRLHFDFRHPVLRRLGKLSAWTLVYVITNSIGFAVSFYLAGALQGGVTAYVTAFAFFQLPIGIAAISVVSALLPKLSALASDGADREFSIRLVGGLKLVALMMLPATAALVILGGPLVKLLLEHGVVSGHSEHLVATTLAWFSVGLLPFAAFQLLMRAFYARQDAKTPALVNLAENAVTIVFDIALYPIMDVRGLALAHGLGYVAGCLIAWRILARRGDGFGDRVLVTELARITIATAMAAIVMLASYLWLDVAFEGELAALTELVIGGVLGLGVFVLAARVLKVEELDTFARLLPARIRIRLGITA